MMLQTLLLAAGQFVLAAQALTDRSLEARAIQPNPRNNGHWIDTWSTMPQLTEPANLPPAPFNTTGAVFVNSTIRQTVKISVGAQQVRLKITNAFGVTNLPITAATIALPANQTAGIYDIQPATLQQLTFSGKQSISIPNGALATSDPVNFNLKSGTIVTITLYLQTGQKTNSITSHPGSRVNSWWQFGNAVSAPSLAVTDVTTQTAAHWYFIDTLQAWVPESSGTLSIVGDSITDGRGSTTNANNRWPDQLFARLQNTTSAGLFKQIGISNQAAGGNRILADGLGPNAFGRIERDVLAHPGTKYAMVFEGVNDIGTANSDNATQAATYDQLVQAYIQMSIKVHSFGIPFFGATITPFNAPSNFTGQPYSTPEREATRQRINKWIRDNSKGDDGSVFDALVDFDAAVRDSSTPPRLREEFNSGDYLHLNPAGYKAMAAAFPLKALQDYADGVDGFY